MKPLILAASALAFLSLAACTEGDTYPISGEECGPNDPVKDLNAADCLPSTGTF